MNERASDGRQQRETRVLSSAFSSHGAVAVQTTHRAAHARDSLRAMQCCWPPLLPSLSSVRCSTPSFLPVSADYPLPRRYSTNGSPLPPHGSSCIAAVHSAACELCAMRGSAVLWAGNVPSSSAQSAPAAPSTSAPPPASSQQQQPQHPQQQQPRGGRQTEMFVAGLVSGVIVAGLFNPWDRSAAAVQETDAALTGQSCALR